MSGIMAIVSLDGRPVPSELARAQLSAIAHRGEWEPRLWEAPGVALGHVNLPRTPEAEREQLPASDITGRYWITWDGRLDNRDELVSLLRLDAEQARQMTDADYVLTAYRELGEACVHKLLGDWAIVIWDSAEGKLFCAKDPLGWRQLYYAEADGLLLMGSEAQQLFAGRRSRPEPNMAYAKDFVSGVLSDSTSSCWSGVREMIGGTTLVVSGAGTIAPSVFWKRPASPPFRGNQDECIDEFTALFEQALRARLRSNRPVGTNLSGGLDSSFIAAAAARSRPDLRAIHAFASTTTRMDERDYAGAVVSHSSISASTLVPIDSCWSLNSEMLHREHFDQPEHPVQAPAVLLLAQAAQRDGVGVVLGGEGGDEWLTGDTGAGDLLLHGHWRVVADIFHRARLHGWSRRTVCGAISREIVPPIATRWPRTRASTHDRALLAAIGHMGPVTARRDSAWDRRATRLDHVWARYRLGANPTIAWRDRHANARFGLEHRTPFNDLRVVEFLAGVPDRMKWFSGRPKAVLRAAGAGLMPSRIADREGYGVYDELYALGVKDRERARAELGLRAWLGDTAFASHAAPHLERSTDPPTPLIWRLITSGLWLVSSGVARPQPTRSLARHLNGKEVMYMKQSYERPSLRTLGDIRSMTQGLINAGCSDAVFGLKGEGIAACFVDGGGGS